MIKNKKNDKFIVGIDEVGRGAIAGPLVLGAAAGYLNNKNKKFLTGIKDSKKLTFNQRLLWYKKFKDSDLNFYCVFISNNFIDKYGMSKSLKEGVKRLLKKIDKKIDLVLLDGGLKAPEKYKQKTIIRGDDKVPFISAASIYAKVKRDLYMIRMDKKINYCFTDHKGYGTKKHFLLIKKNGISKVHRKTFIKNIVKK
ncbi:MAG TPA: ribonuclease HII [Candidatus Paceibacterota bacterium]|nr:ribonuclease HII [Candidatus Paceibacterota bacterium]